MSDSMRGSYEDRMLDKGVKYWYVEAGKLEAQAAKYRKALEEIRQHLIDEEELTFSEDKIFKITSDALKS